MKLDMYSLKARLAPTFLLSLPILLAVVAWLTFDFTVLKSLASFAVYCGLFFFLSELGRDQGRKKQTALFKSWGGTPSTRMLRHRDTSLDVVTLARYHSYLSGAIDKRLPSKAEETADPGAADEIFDSAVKWLLEKTRDESKFPLLLKENISYGFRRNLWGMKPAGILICLIALAVSIMPACQAFLNDRPLPVLPLTMTTLVIMLLVLWIFRITPGWVRTAAEAYALRLLAACDQLAGETPPKTNLIITSPGNR
jgi:hypothetical protein